MVFWDTLYVYHTLAYLAYLAATAYDIGGRNLATYAPYRILKTQKVAEYQSGGTWDHDIYFQKFSRNKTN